ncbi:helix-turn-helix domain-containing protein [Pedobacter rhizosphaerae]|uniref:DNA-binding transcriptional regulator, XRE-family HTH domain n=1 Tax=Pedobacter rhizosphaerae TaxID=390241 RepID=A0A1H9PCT4_9SPHI|nr:helix-turn-helix transcriptional regulator [Pedobacter rhizosphaerae]SER45961.1 DNA-binding transcriptional regulator, XRE-family HTH domain [Pedobacter rhizosphaerae]
MNAVGENIKKSRIELGLSQAQAAKMLQISTPAFCKIETGQTDLNVSRLLQIAKVFKVKVDRLLYGTTNKADSSEEINVLKAELLVKDEELNKLRKKIIDLYDKLGM